MSWRCGECGAKWSEATPRCASCDAGEISQLREENRLLRLAVTEFAQEVKELKAETDRYRVSVSAHHNIATLSDAAIRESIGGSCQVCARAHRAHATTGDCGAVASD